MTDREVPIGKIGFWTKRAKEADRRKQKSNYLQNQVNEEQCVEGAGLSLNQQGLGLFCYI